MGEIAETPRQVPAPTASWVDRDDELAWMSDLAEEFREQSLIAVLEGLGGVGKRSVARRWAQQQPRMRQLHVDCAKYGAGLGEGTVDVAGIIGKCLRDLDVDPSHIPTREERREEFLKRTSSAPTLVVVENATEPAQVCYLIPNCPGSLVVVTTSADLGGLRLEGAQVRKLRGLDNKNALDLLKKICGSERITAGPGDARELVRWCAGLPLAVAILAARLASTDSLTVAELAAELADEARRLAGLALGDEVSVSAVFTVAYEALPESARGLYRLLGTLPCVDVSPGIVAAAAGLDEGQARSGLDKLVSAHLAEYQRDDRRYGLHDLARLHARERSRDEDTAQTREAALRAVVGHFVVRAAFADRETMFKNRSRATRHHVLLAGHENPFTGPDPREQALEWLDSERANLVAIAEAAADAGWNAETWQLAEALMGYWYNRRHLSDWVTVSNLGVVAAQASGNVEAEARLRLSLSRAYTDLKELGRASAELDAAAVLADSSGDLVLKASVWEFRGRYLDVTDPPAALDAYRRAYELNVAGKEWRGAALVRYFAGCNLEAAGRHEEALESLWSALGELRRLGDDRMAGRTLIAIGAAQASLHQEAEASASLMEALDLLRGLHYEGQAQEALARIAGESGDRAAERGHLREAARIYGETRHPKAAEINERLGGDEAS